MATVIPQRMLQCASSLSSLQRNNMKVSSSPLILARTKFRIRACQDAVAKGSPVAKCRLHIVSPIHHTASRLHPVSCHAKRKGGGRPKQEVEPDPWEGAVVFAPVTNGSTYSFATTLERLGLDDLSSADSVREAGALRAAGPEPTIPGVAKGNEEEGGEGSRSQGEEVGTRVLISMDVVPSGKDLVATGTVDTVFGLQCTRCFAPTTYPVEASFELLLTASPVVEPTLRSMGVVLGDRRWDAEDLDEGAFLDGMEGGGASTGLLDLDLDDKIHFPVTQSSVDLSKYFRDTVHLELPLKVLCREDCKGMCLDCGVNLNVKTCRCGDEGEELGLGGGPGGGVFGAGKGSLAAQLRAELKKREKPNN